jgi:DNA-binding CsgD family transcriptional regulator
VDASLDAAMRTLADRVGAASHSAGADALRERAVLLQLGVARSALRSGALTGSARIADLSALLRGLRSFLSLADLLDGAPAQVHQTGFGRVMVSRVQDGLWLARSGSVDGDPELTRQLVRVGTEHPGTLNGAMIETEVVRRRQPILVRDAWRNARVHRQLRDLLDCRAYVAAPVLAHGSVAGLIHADQNAETGTVDAHDRELLGMVAEGIGSAVERVVFLERLQAMRRRLDDHSRAVGDLIDEFIDGEIRLSAADAVPSPPVPTAREPLPDAWPGDSEGCLTRREADVLRHMALGETNAQIARRLFVSEGTVKTHVKHILRKLGAANRAEAVSRYHLRTHDGTRGSRSSARER